MRREAGLPLSFPGGPSFVFEAIDSDLMAEAMSLARRLIQKQPRVLSAAKQALNAIDTFDLAKSYRLEQGFTYELNLLGDGSAARDAFVRGDRIITR